MAVNKNPTNTHPDNTTAIVGDQGKRVKQDPSTDRVTTTSVDRGDGNLPFSGHDLVADGDFVIPDDIDAISDPPFIGGGTQSILGVESTDDNQFSVTFEYGVLDSDGNFQVRFTFDKSDDSDLDSDSSYIISINPVLDRVKVTISDTSGAGQNTIQGGLNSH